MRSKRENIPLNRGTFASGFAASALIAALGLSAAVVDAAATRLAGDPIRGKALYQGCSACHSVDDNDLGPKHRGVVGRRAGSVADYNYSPALKNSGLTWDEVTLDHWLANPSELVPGTKMYFKIDDAQSRADIIAYLQDLK